MSSLLPRLLTFAPPLAKRQALVQLFGATAAAFQREMPVLRGLAREQCLLTYARLTAEWAEAALRGDNRVDLQARLYLNAYHLGRVPARLLLVRRVDDVMSLARFLYGILDIDLEGTGAGEIMIGACYFSSFYTPEVCKLMSAMDRGLLAGLAGGGELVFIQRITEGQACCRAYFHTGDGVAGCAHLPKEHPT